MITEQATSRRALEQSLIGCCLTYAGAYGQLANILSAKNFTRWIHQYDENYALIWQIFGEMYPRQAIDIRTVIHYGVHYHKQDAVIFPLHIMQASSCPVNPARMWGYAYLLLEFDIQNKFCELLLSIGVKLHEDDYRTAKACILECYEIVKNRMHPDLIETIMGLVQYMKQVGVPEEGIAQCNEFVAAIEDKLGHKKKHRVLNVILENLNHYGNITDAPETATALKHLFEITRLLCNKQNATPFFNSQLTYLKQELTKA